MFSFECWRLLLKLERHRPRDKYISIIDQMNMHFLMCKMLKFLSHQFGSAMIENNRPGSRSVLKPMAMGLWIFLCKSFLYCCDIADMGKR
jgi:hypothetical protein